MVEKIMKKILQNATLRKKKKKTLKSLLILNMCPFLNIKPGKGN